MKIYIYGIVQGVGFRPTVYRIAKSLKLKGYVRNNGSNVEIFVEKDCNKFIEKLKEELPPLARIDKIEFVETSEELKIKDFVVLKSSNGLRSSLLPADTALCKNCVEELFDEKNRRCLYPFTNCTDCGARFSVIEDAPYDRIKTSMSPFKMCRECQKEYSSPEDRRFHAQTISCLKCGPKYILYDKNKKYLKGGTSSIKEFAGLLDKGYIGNTKSWGGMHLCCSLNFIPKFREWYKRKEKPFAVMMKDLSTVKKYAEVSRFEESLLLSSKKPIVLLSKKYTRSNCKILENISPGLNNIGVMLPYSGLHHILFHFLKADGLVMTSANPAGEPMVIENESAFKLNADYYLLHNRKIINRCDDSVLRTYRNNIFFLRKSRGYVPNLLRMPFKGSFLGVGAEENLSASITKDGYLYTSQYIGDGSHYDVLRFLEYGIEHLIKINAIQKLDAVGIDLHPRYATRSLGKNYADRFDAKLIETQHHWAHAVSLMLDNNIEEQIIALTLDGTGYGSDGKAWGGEILYASYDEFQRIGSLEEIPLIGGETAVYDPRRLVFAISETIETDCKYFSEKEKELFRKMMKSSVMTTSMGRLLDTLSCYFGICCNRTYDGEPAMKLEKYLAQGRLKYNFKTEILERDRKIIRTIPLFEQLFGIKNYSERQKADLTYSFVHTVLQKMVEIAAEEAKNHKIKYIGITGGVSYNIPIVKIVEHLVKKNDLKLLLHNQVPNGDGGISVGQCGIAGRMLK